MRKDSNMGIDAQVDKILKSYEEYGGINCSGAESFPNRENVVSVIHDLQSLINPGYKTAEDLDKTNLRYVTGQKINRIISMLTKEMSAVDFSKDAKRVHDLVRGLNSWPCASAVLNGKRVKLLRTAVTNGSGQPGQVLSLDPFVVACGSGAVEILELQPEGKKTMAAKAFVNGLHAKNAEELKFT